MKPRPKPEVVNEAKYTRTCKRGTKVIASVLMIYTEHKI